MSLWIKSYSAIIQVKATEQYFPVVLFIMLYKVVLSSESVDEIVKCDCIQMKATQGAKKIIFTACHLGKLKLAFTSPEVISTSPKNVWLAKLISQFWMLFESFKSHHLPVRQVKNRIHQPDSKLHKPRAIGHYFLCTLLLQIDVFNFQKLFVNVDFLLFDLTYLSTIKYLEDFDQMIS